MIGPLLLFYPFPGKPRGMRAARKLRNRRRVQKWADKAYKKAHLGTRWKANPFGGSSHAKGIVVEKLGIEAKQVGGCCLFSGILVGTCVACIASTVSPSVLFAWKLYLVV